MEYYRNQGHVNPILNRSIEPFTKGIHDCTPFCSRGLIVGLGGLIEFVHAAEDVGWEFETGFFQTIFKVGTEACTFQRTAT